MRVAEGTYGQFDVGAEALVKLFSSGGSPGGQADVKRLWLGLTGARLRPMRERSWVLVCQPGQGDAQVVPDGHAADGTRWPIRTSACRCWPETFPARRSSAESVTSAVKGLLKGEAKLGPGHTDVLVLAWPAPAVARRSDHLLW